MAKDDFAVETGTVTLVPTLSSTERTFNGVFLCIGCLVVLAIVECVVIGQKFSQQQRSIDTLSRDVLTLQQDYQQLRDDLDSHDLNASVHGGTSPGLQQSRVDAAIMRAAEKLWDKSFDPPPGTVGQMLRAVEVSEHDN